MQIRIINKCLVSFARRNFINTALQLELMKRFPLTICFCVVEGGERTWENNQKEFNVDPVCG
jgi:hypothetical protein